MSAAPVYCLQPSLILVATGLASADLCNTTDGKLEL